MRRCLPKSCEHLKFSHPTYTVDTVKHTLSTYCTAHWLLGVVFVLPPFRPIHHLFLLSQVQLAGQYFPSWRTQTVCHQICSLLLRNNHPTPHGRPFLLLTLLAMIGDSTKALGDRGISLVSFLTALAASLVVFGIQMGLFLLLRNKLARIL